MRPVVYTLLALLVLLSPAPASAAPISPAVEYGTTGTLTDSRPFTLGYSFTMSAPFTVDALGVWIDGLSNSHQVGLWTSAGTLLASTTVLSTDPTQGHFRWHDIADLLLPAGTYVIGAEFLGNGHSFPFQATGVVTIPGYTWVDDRQIQGAGLNFPTGVFGGYGQNGILYANFAISTVPEPASLALFGLAGLTAGYVGWRRRKPATA